MKLEQIEVNSSNWNTVWESIDDLYLLTFIDRKKWRSNETERALSMRRINGYTINELMDLLRMEKGILVKITE